MLGAAGGKTLAAQYGPARLWFEGHAVALAALIANDLEAFALSSATASLTRTAKVGSARVATWLAAFGVTQSALAIIILFSFSKWEGCSALGASNFQIWHNYLPRKTILRT